MSDEPEFECEVCFGETHSHDDLCADCEARFERGELVDCPGCGAICDVRVGACFCGAAIKGEVR